MILRSLNLQNFRSYKKAAFELNPHVTYVIGENTAGKSNLIEAMSYLSSGKSFRAEKELQVIKFGEDVARVKGVIVDEDEKTTLETVFAFLPSEHREPFFQKKFLVNNLPKRRVDFAGLLPSVLFTPEDLELVIGSPSLRRGFFDTVLEQVDREYRLAVTAFTKALRQRNALLEIARETGRRNAEQFAYWDELLIMNGTIITARREDLVKFLNHEGKDLFPFQIVYDPSRISTERLAQYKEAELGAGVTLVGPHRDDFSMEIPIGKDQKDVRYFGSRGQQRLVVLQLKLLQITFMEQRLGERPLLILDDIFSELDSRHIQHVLREIPKQQTVVTTTHKEFITPEIAPGEIITLQK